MTLHVISGIVIVICLVLVYKSGYNAGMEDFIYEYEDKDNANENE